MSTELTTLVISADMVPARGVNWSPAEGRRIMVNDQVRVFLDAYALLALFVSVAKPQNLSPKRFEPPLIPTHTIHRLPASIRLEMDDLWRNGRSQLHRQDASPDLLLYIDRLHTLLILNPEAIQKLTT